MSDEELCKRLLDFDKVTVGDARDAALRIKALTAENARLERVVEDLSDEVDLAEQEASTVEDDFVKAEKEIEALTAKLAKVMKAADRMLDAFCVHETQQQVEAYNGMCATLAEIEGEKT
jgi:predicted  nucleic acid-binding Zn-ribbon protein